jgi:uncharacterized protein (TIGR02246 family)
MDMTEIAISAQDYADIMQVVSRYAWAFNTGDLKALGETFTPDGILQGSSGQRHEGRKAIIGYARQLVNTAVFRGRQHMIYNFLVEKAAVDRYQTRSYWSVIYWNGETNEKRMDSTGYSEDIFVKIDGKWFFSERLIFHWKSNQGPWIGH